MLATVLATLLAVIVQSLETPVFAGVLACRYPVRYYVSYYVSLPVSSVLAVVCKSPVNAENTRFFGCFQPVNDHVSSLLADHPENGIKYPRFFAGVFIV